MTGRDCERYVRAAIESLVWQTHPSIHVLFVDDASRDRSHEIAHRLLGDYFPGRHTLVRNAEPWGKARSAHVHLRAALGHGDFVATLDADDQLIVATALAQMAAEYAAGHDVVWTQYESDDGAVGGNGPLDLLQSPRGQGWKTGPGFSFRAELLANVPAECFQDERGDWFTAACDAALAYPLLDQTRRWRFLPLRAYRHTAAKTHAPPDHDKQDSARQVLAKPALACTRWAFASGPGADAALLSVRQRVLHELQGVAKTLETTQRPTDAATPPAATNAGDAWTHAAAATLAQRCPAWLDLALDGQAAPLDVPTAAHWWRWLQAGPACPRVLEIGAGAWAAPLHAAVHALGGYMVSAVGERDRALALYARLHAVGVDAEVLHLPMADAALDDVEGRFPDLSQMPPEATDFDLLVISAPQAGAAPRDALLALPMAAGRLRAGGWRACVWSPDDAALRVAAAQAWRRLAPELSFTEHAFNARALCVQTDS